MSVFRTFEQLSEEEQGRAVDVCYLELVEAVTEGAIRFDDDANGDNLQAAVDGAWAEAEAMRTPWFASEYIAAAVRTWSPGGGLGPMSETVGECLRGMARCEAAEAVYPDGDVRVIQLSAAAPAAVSSGENGAGFPVETGS